MWNQGYSHSNSFNSCGINIKSTPTTTVSLYKYYALSIFMVDSHNAFSILSIDRGMLYYCKWSMHEIFSFCDLRIYFPSAATASLDRFTALVQQINTSGAIEHKAHHNSLCSELHPSILNPSRPNGQSGSVYPSNTNSRSKRQYQLHNDSDVTPRNLRMEIDKSSEEQCGGVQASQILAVALTDETKKSTACIAEVSSFPKVGMSELPCTRSLEKTNARTETAIACLADVPEDADNHGNENYGIQKMTTMDEVVVSSPLSRRLHQRLKHESVIELKRILEIPISSNDVCKQILTCEEQLDDQLQSPTSQFYLSSPVVRHAQRRLGDIWQLMEEFGTGSAFIDAAVSGVTLRKKKSQDKQPPTEGMASEITEKANTEKTKKEKVGCLVQ